MSKRVVNSPEIEAKDKFASVQEKEYYILYYFFENASPPDGISEEDYLKEFREEYYKLKKEEARRFLGLDIKFKD